MAGKTPQHIADECIRLRRDERLPLRVIAKKVGVSVSTASILLRGHPLSQEEQAEALRRAARASHQARRPRFLHGISKKEMTGTTVHKGEIAFLHCALRAAERGQIISRPTIECRYDAVIDDGRILSRVQVKLGNAFRNGAVEVNLARRGKVYLAEDVDALLVYIPAVEKVVWLPPEKFVGRVRISIRVAPAANGQKLKILDADDYLW